MKKNQMLLYALGALALYYLFLRKPAAAIPAPAAPAFNPNVI